MTQFEQVKQLMLERKLPVYKALKVLGIRSNTFYESLTEQQKTELRHIKVSFAQKGGRFNKGKGL